MVIPFNNMLPAANTPRRSILLRLASYAVSSSGKDNRRFSRRRSIPAELSRRDVWSDVRFRNSLSAGDRIDGALPPPPELWT